MVYLVVLEVYFHINKKVKGMKEMEILALGSVVKLNHGLQKVMITSRVPLYNYNGQIGFFDYSGCLYPNGQNGQQTFFFNQEDIAKVFHMGYVDESEEEYCKFYEKKIDKVKYPRYTIDKINGMRS